MKKGLITKKRIVLAILLALMAIAYGSGGYFIDMYLSYKYPSPVKYYGLEIPVDKGFYYTVTENMLHIYNPSNEEYGIDIVRSFRPAPSSHISSFEELLKFNKEMIVKIENHERNGIKYIESFSVDKHWEFKISTFFPEKNLMLNFHGSKKEYSKYEEVIDHILGTFSLYQIY